MCAKCMNVSKRTTKRIVRRTNNKLLLGWLNENAPKGREKLVAGCEYAFGPGAIDKWFDRGNAPKLTNRTKICQFTGFDMDDLFPIATPTKKRTAS